MAVVQKSQSSGWLTEYNSCGETVLETFLCSTLGIDSVGPDILGYDKESNFWKHSRWVQYEGLETTEHCHVTKSKSLWLSSITTKFRAFSTRKNDQIL